jgi:hypothetical protein
LACEIVSVDGAVFALWGKPSKHDLNRVLAEVERVATTSGHPIVYIARIPQNAPAPEGDARAHMNSLMPQFIKHCASYHAVLEGGGFLSAVKRAILAGLLQFGVRSGMFFVHKSEKEILEKVDRKLRPNVQAVLALASNKGLLTAPAPEQLANAR